MTYNVMTSWRDVTIWNILSVIWRDVRALRHDNWRHVTHGTASWCHVTSRHSVLTSFDDCSARIVTKRARRWRARQRSGVFIHWKYNENSGTFSKSSFISSMNTIHLIQANTYLCLFLQVCKKYEAGFDVLSMVHDSSCYAFYGEIYSGSVYHSGFWVCSIEINVVLHIKWLSGNFLFVEEVRNLKHRKVSVTAQ